jgi:F-type H+-transporting ATPase subunit delta
LNRSPYISYAKALVDLAIESKEGDQIAEQLEQVSRKLEESPSWKSFLERPDLDHEERLLILGPLLDVLAIKGLARRFLMLLLQKKRLRSLPRICRRYRELLDSQQRRVRVVLSVPFPLAAEELTSLKDGLAERIGKEVILSQREDTSLLGGWIAQIGTSELWDASIRGELARMKLKLLGSEGSLEDKG